MRKGFFADLFTTFMILFTVVLIIVFIMIYNFMIHAPLLGKGDSPIKYTMDFEEIQQNPYLFAEALSHGEKNNFFDNFVMLFNGNINPDCDAWLDKYDFTYYNVSLDSDTICSYKSNQVAARDTNIDRIELPIFYKSDHKLIDIKVVL